MGTATAIMVVCEDNARRGGRGGHDSPAGVDGRVRGRDGAGRGLLPAAGLAAAGPGGGAGDADGAGAAQLLVTGRGAGAWRGAPRQHLLSPRARGPRPAPGRLPAPAAPALAPQ